MPFSTTPNSTELTLVDDQLKEMSCGDGTTVLQNTVGVVVSKLSIAALVAGGGGGATVGSAGADVVGVALGVDAGVALEDGDTDGDADGAATGAAEPRVSSVMSAMTSAANRSAPITAKTMMRLRERGASLTSAGGVSTGGVTNNSVGLASSGKSNFRVRSSSLIVLSVPSIGNARTTTA